MWRKLKLFCVFLFMGIASLLPLVLSQGIRFPDQDPPGTGSSQSFLGSALSGNIYGANLINITTAFLSLPVS